ncbi:MULTISPECIES: penicillin-binding protein activator LpoB [Enterovibrio]|uniref:Penicillin-binding protein activator LpoB n=2 Tax=Enterovibrio norvegicus TaxID=188144 RepID=A0A2N7L3V1_9GAMM|nr:MULTISPECIES: penicillin-binding protein activator LpoB [Enterovibrio]MBE1274237.1 penicillin-binding protein activator LpoB [Enterovibrio baiacu]MCC4798876.1 penicillin-binding protein activator LpoB [Enterovibrio norvegicus]OEE43273.1 penicillin-binding protein activator LpoB [Enterovibrio norvegicus]OEF55787.1 penicillin-binding protein activator LpoB [Enterovibrio norvegicus]OEF59786.1 penicillin-binding protein activator LpoB [Enterovibrio norvegicus]
MNKSVIALMSVALIMGGCSQKVSYGDAQEVETTTIEFGSTDLQKIAVDMTDSMLSSGAISAITRNDRPIVFVESIKNKTAEHIDTESITDSISTRMLKSGKFRFVDMTRVDAVRDQLDFQNNDALVNPGTAIQFGKMVGAQYMLYGNLSSINKRAGSDEDVYYKMTMRLMDLETGLIEWADETEIRKKQSKSVLGW